MDTANNLWIPALSCLFFIGIFAVLFIVAQQSQKKVKASWRKIEEQLGLMNNKPDAIYPELKGKIDGIEIAVDIIQQQYTRSQPGTGSRPWTRIRAQLSEKPTFQALSRHQKYEEAIEWPIKQTGDAALDAKYQFFVPDGVSLDDALPASVREALLVANPPVHVLKKVVLWSQIKVVKDAELMKRAIQSCVDVAKVIEPSDW